MSNVEKIIGLLQHGETLKNIDRSGWVLSGVESERVESVAEHSYGSIISSIIIAQSLKPTNVAVNVDRVVIMAALHDLPEAITGDIARTDEFQENKDNVKAKQLAEKTAIEGMFGPLGGHFEELQNIWEEFDLGKSLESRIVKGADVIDMLFHARSLEKSGASPQILHQFFKSSRPLINSIAIELVTQIYNTLYQEHERAANTQNLELK